MSTTRVSLADLRTQPHEYSPEEIAFRANATDGDLHKGALADPDAQPWTDDMLRRAQVARELRQGEVSLAVTDLMLEPADLSSDLPTWVVTDEHGARIHLQAVSVRPAAPGATSSAVKIVPSSSHGKRLSNHRLPSQARRHNDP